MGANTSDLKALWEELKQAQDRIAEAQDNFRRVRDQITARLCSCYRHGEDWEQRAAQCVTRLSGRCPYYLELRKRGMG